MPEEERLSKFILEASSNIINKILFIRIIEDKGFVRPKLTKQFVREWKETWSTDKLQNIMKLFKDACEQAEGLYNGGLFELNPYDTLPYDNNTIENIMGLLGDFNFEEIDADVIGRIYEIYLGTLLSVEEEIRGKKRTKLSSDFTERKKLGQYYTPKFIVDYIVKNTLGKLLEGKTPEEVSKIKILDPACGSGSFLIRAFDYLKDYYIKYNDQQISKTKNGNLKDMNNYIKNGIIVDYNHKILRENLHGVDLNDLSTQICSINLWLRALEKDKKLEKLSKNILHGNSLISGVESREELVKYKNEMMEIAKLRHKIKEYYGKELSRKEDDELNNMESKLKELKDRINKPLNENLKKYFENLDLVHPFNWEAEFTEAFEPDKPEEEQGFDVVIGNPPYVDIKSMSAKQVKGLFTFFETSENRINLYSIFIEKSIQLLKKGGYFGFIIPNSILFNSSYKKIRKLLLQKTNLLSIIRLPDNVFEDAKVETIILIFKKKEASEIDKTNILIYDREDQINLISNKTAKKRLTIQQKSWEKNGDYIFNIFTGVEINELIVKIEKNTEPLEKLADFSLGLTPYDKYKGHSDSQIKGKIFHSEYKKDETYKKLLSGEDIIRYRICWNEKEWIKYGESLGAPREQRFFTNPRIVVRQIVSGKPLRIYAAYSNDELYNTQIAFNIITKNEG